MELLVVEKSGKVGLAESFLFVLEERFEGAIIEAGGEADSLAALLRVAGAESGRKSGAATKSAGGSGGGVGGGGGKMSGGRSGFRESSHESVGKLLDEIQNLLGRVYGAVAEEAYEDVRGAVGNGLQTPRQLIDRLKSGFDRGRRRSGVGAMGVGGGGVDDR